MVYKINPSESKSEYASELFKVNGFLVVRNLISPKVLSEIYNQIKSIDQLSWSKNYGGRTAFLNCKDLEKKPLCGVSYVQPLTSYSPLSNKIYGKELLEVSSNLLCVNDVFYNGNELHVRHTDQEHFIPSHQDNFYFSLANPIALTCYIGLTDQSRINGGLGFLKHAEDKTFMHAAGKIEGFSSYHPETEANPDDFIYPETEPGDVIFHHCETFHRADPNQTSKTSVAISTRILSMSNSDKDSSIFESYSKNLAYNRS